MNFCTGNKFFAVSIVKLKNVNTSACLNLNYVQQSSKQKCEGYKDGGINQNFLPIPLQV